MAEKSTRRFSCWCPRCPTRVYIETEDDGTNPGRDCLPFVDACPVCGHALEDIAILTGTGRIPYYHNGQNRPPQSAAIHAAWLVSSRDKQ